MRGVRDSPHSPESCARRTRLCLFKGAEAGAVQGLWEYLQSESEVAVHLPAGHGQLQGLQAGAAAGA